MNIFLQIPKCLTLEEFIESSNSKLKELTNEEINKYIIRAENLISTKVDVPEEVPVSLKQAIFLLTERLFNIENKKDKVLIEEKDENHSRRYEVLDKNKLKKIFNEEILALLEPFLKKKSAGKFYKT